MLYEAIPVWERAYAVSETKRSVEGAAGTRGADKVTSPSPPCVNLPGYTSKFTIFSQKISCIFEFVVLYYIPNKGNDQTGQFLNKTSCRRLLRNQIFGGKDKMNTLKAEKRSMDDKAKKLRREGYVTGNVFGRSLAESIPVKIEKKEAERFLSVCNKGSEAKLTIDTTDYDVLVKEVDYDPIKRQTLEIDFQVLTEGEKVHSVAEIVLVNHDKVQGVVEQHMEEIPYKAAKSALVEKVSVDIGELKPGDSIKVGDLDIAKDKDVSISPDVLEKVIVSVTEQTYAETDTDTDEDGEVSEA